MPESRTVAALQAARTTIHRHLVAAFSQLDSQTPHVEIRRQLYTDLIRQAIQLAGERFPDDRALLDMIDKLLGPLAVPQAALAQSR